MATTFKKIFAKIAICSKFDQMTGPELKELRTRSGESQRDIATLLGVQNSTVARWETDEDAVIPVPAMKLLELYFYGKKPFGEVMTDPAKDVFPKLVLNLEEFEQLLSDARKSGFSDIRSYIVFVIRRHLRSVTGTSRGDTPKTVYPETEPEIARGLALNEGDSTP